LVTGEEYASYEIETLAEHILSFSLQSLDAQRTALRAKGAHQ
jgi:hypothetical protein